MPLPIWLIPVALKGAAVVAGAAGVGAAAHGAKKMKDANDTMKAAQSRHERKLFAIILLICVRLLISIMKRFLR